MSGFGSRFHELEVIPDLVELMRQTDASILTLAEVSGVSDWTICKARRCEPIRKYLACCIKDALQKFKFKRYVRDKR